jgi:RNA polymerase sigma-70 factor (ECF subfamily)
VSESAQHALEHVQPDQPESPTTAEVDLVKRARQGDREAFGRLTADRIEPAFRTAMAILGHEADARDATQEVFVKAWRELGALRDLHRFDAWLGSIVVNTCRSALRRRHQSRAREISVEAMAEGLGLPQDRSGPDFADQSAELDLLERAFDRLVPDDRVLLVMHHMDHRPVALIASSLGIPEGTAKSRLHTARRRLGAAIEVERQ